MVTCYGGRRAGNLVGHSAHRPRSQRPQIAFAASLLGLVTPCAWAQSGEIPPPPPRPKPAEKPRRAIIPESAGLPVQVLRLRGGYRHLLSERGFDGDAAEYATGLSIALNFAYLAIEYGIIENLSGQLVVPWSLGGGPSVTDRTAFTDSKLRPQVEAAVDSQLAPLLSRIKTLYDSNSPAPENITNPQNGQVLIPAGTPARDGFNRVRRTLIDQAMANNYDQARAVAEERTLQEGLGDIEAGVKYSLSTMSHPWFEGIPLYTSVSGGFRFNTSGYDIAAAGGEIPSGRGTTDFGLRLNADYEFLLGLQLQVENQSEVMLVGGKSWDKPEVDGGKEVDFTREGLRQIGYAKLVIGPGAWWEPIRILQFSGRYTWDNDPPTKTGETKSAVQVKRAAQAGVTLNGLPYGIPVQLDYDYVYALPSPNIAAAFDSHQVEVKAFYRF